MIEKNIKDMPGTTLSSVGEKKKVLLIFILNFAIVIYFFALNTGFFFFKM